MILSWISSLSAIAAKASVDAKNILKRVEKNVSSADEIASLKMIVLESNGDRLERSLEIRRNGN